ncbi:proteasome assembly chaperone 4 [Phoenix dactylifera]|uniref:Proteasome assembly chaperone 4 n=1 Tax=Phoenix dactylifera TaxID=42345 RepID=A0A8B7BHC4_PHODC|nr:proteasome assembly chaperone 4 [Phoenix dactylifera]
MASGELNLDFSAQHISTDAHCNGKGKILEDQAIDSDVQITCFTEDLHDVTLHFQIIKLAKQIYVWIGCNTARFGHLYAAAATRPNNAVSVTSLIGGSSDNAGSSIARRLGLKTGLSIVLACNIPKDSPMVEATAERKLVEKLRNLGYIKATPEGMRVTLAES